MLLYALSVAVLRHGPYEVRLKGDCYSMRRQRGTTSTEMENSKKGESQVPTSVFIQSSNFRPARITEPLTDFHTNHFVSEVGLGFPWGRGEIGRYAAQLVKRPAIG